MTSVCSHKHLTLIMQIIADADDFSSQPRLVLSHFPSAQINVMGPAAGQWAVQHAWLIEKSKEIKTIALLNWGARKVMKKRWPRRLRANGKRKADMHRYYSYYWWFKSFTEKRGMMGILLLNLSDFAGAVNLTSEVSTSFSPTFPR